MSDTWNKCFRTINCFQKYTGIVEVGKRCRHEVHFIILKRFIILKERWKYGAGSKNGKEGRQGRIEESFLESYCNIPTNLTMVTHFNINLFKLRIYQYISSINLVIIFRSKIYSCTMLQHKSSHFKCFNRCYQFALCVTM